jgi:hypothetical protein
LYDHIICYYLSIILEPLSPGVLEDGHSILDPVREMKVRQNPGADDNSSPTTIWWWMLARV